MATKRILPQGGQTEAVVANEIFADEKDWTSSGGGRPNHASIRCNQRELEQGGYWAQDNRINPNIGFVDVKWNAMFTSQRQIIVRIENDVRIRYSGKNLNEVPCLNALIDRA